jgi:hypothetical protein
MSLSVRLTSTGSKKTVSIHGASTSERVRVRKFTFSFVAKLKCSTYDIKHSLNYANFGDKFLIRKRRLMNKISIFLTLFSAPLGGLMECERENI